MMGLLGKEAEMTLLSYTNADRNKGEKTITLPYKPESLSLKMANNISTECPINTISGNTQYQGGEPSEVSVTFYYDATIYADSLTSFVTGSLTGDRDLKKKIQELMKTLYSMDGASHESRFLILKWGEMPIGNSVNGGFYCRLKDLDLKYVLTNLEGKPLIVEVTCTFIEHLSEKALDKKEGKNSPDLTHIRLVVNEDKLPYKTWDIYQDPKYLIELAKVNKLNHFRRLQPGQSIIFPPLESES